VAASELIARRATLPTLNLGDRRVFILVIAVLAAVYVVAGKLGLTLAFVHVSATAIWPPTGIAIAAFLLLGYRIWPGILLGAFLVNLTTAGDALSSLGIATGNTLEGLVAAALVNRFANGRRAFERPLDVIKFALLAAVASTAVSATLGVTSLALTGYASWSDFGAIWLTWWLGDAGGALILAPALVLWANEPRVRWSSREELEAIGALAALVLVGFLVFGGLEPLSREHYPQQFLVFPVLVWVAFRFGPRESATAIVVLSAIAIWGTLQQYGPFGGRPQNEALLLLQAFTAVTALTTLALAAAEARLREVERREVAARDEFISIAAHELRTPLTSLHAAVQFLGRQPERGTVDTEQLRQALATVEDRTAKLGQLITVLLESVRVRADRPDLDLRLHDVTALVASVVAQAQATTAQHELVVSGPPVQARIDEVRFEEVVTNLLENAIKFSPSGGRIDVDLSAANGTLQLVLRDRGIGIPVERRARMFEPYYQAHPGTERSGLGLGLYVSRRIVEQHGGTIRADFPSDGGTRFVLSLPTRA